MSTGKYDSDSSVATLCSKNMACEATLYVHSLHLSTCAFSTFLLYLTDH